ncbi:hypothetical protein G6F24_014491 [Rhizopus arrhizus]|nr:hypothetical protein G6F24_014491 [Rhizopus arrhizus]
MRLSWPSVPGSAASVSIGGNGAVEVLPPPLPAATASARAGHHQRTRLARHDRIAAGDLQAWRAAVEGLFVLCWFGEHLRIGADIRHRQIAELRARRAFGNRFDHHIGGLTGAGAGRRTGVAQLQALQRQPRLRRLRRLCLNLQRAVGAGGIHAAVAPAKEVVEEATGTAPAEARTRQPQCAAALGDQQEAALDHVVAAPVDLAHIGAVIAHALQ